MRDGRDILYSARQIWDCIGSEASATCTNGSSLDQLILNLGIGSRSSKGLIKNSCSMYNPLNDQKIMNVNASACAPNYNSCAPDPDGPSQIEGTVFYEQLTRSAFGNWEASRSMMGEIYLNGPVVTVITMNRQDFVNFTRDSFIKNGIVFVPSTITSLKNTDRHCLMVYGWGQDEVTGLNYWLVQNSWGESWADGGTAKIIRGMNWLENEWRGVFTSPRPCIKGGEKCFNVSSSSISSGSNIDKSKQLSLKQLQYIHDNNNHNNRLLYLVSPGQLSNMEIFLTTMGASIALGAMVYFFSPRLKVYGNRSISSSSSSSKKNNAGDGNNYYFGNSSDAVIRLQPAPFFSQQPLNSSTQSFFRVY